MFLKAASKKAQRPFADAYREEIRKLRGLPSRLPVPRLLWTHEDDLWVLLALEHVEGRHPERPWSRADLDALPGHARAAGPDADARRRSSCGTFAEDFADCPPAGTTSGRRPRTGRTSRRPPRSPPATPRRRRGNTLVHTDARDDNFLLR